MSELNENATTPKSDAASMAALPFAALTYPHQDIAVVSGPHDRLPALSDELGLIFTDLSDEPETQLCSLSTGPVANRDSESLLFSGSAKGSDRLVFGQDDLVDPDEVQEAVGDHVLLRVAANRATIRTDYFGIAKLFLFQDGDHAIISNRYHLILLICKRLGKALTLDKQKIAANFALHGQVFTQLFSNRMDVAEIRMLPIGTAAMIEGGRARITDTAIRSDIAAAATDPVDNYRGRLAASADEIVSNLEAALKHERFRNVRVDLTAGLDARLVFTALSRLPQYASKVRIHTADVPASPEDLPISLALTSTGPWKYDDLGRSYEWVRKDASQETMLSLDLGTYYGRSPVNAHALLTDTLRVSGFYGEIAARPYYARLQFGRVTDDMADGSLVTKVIQPGRQSAPEREWLLLRDMLTETVATLPGQTALERWDLHYLAFRNGLHCTDKWLAKTVGPSWGPLQSKELFRLKCAMFQGEKSIKLQLDLINELNPDLARFPFGREKDNLERTALAARLGKPEIQYMSAVPQIDRSGYDASKASQNKRITHLNPTERESIAAENRDFVSRVRARANAAARLLVSNGIMDEETVQKHVLTVIDGLSDSSLYVGKNVVLINKLLDAAHQISIVQEPSPLPQAGGEPKRAVSSSLLARLKRRLGLGAGAVR